MKQKFSYISSLWTGNSMSHCLDHYIIFKFHFKANLAAQALNWRIFFFAIDTKLKGPLFYDHYHWIVLNFCSTHEFTISFFSLDSSALHKQIWNRKTNIFQSGQKSTENTNKVHIKVGNLVSLANRYIHTIRKNSWNQISQVHSVEKYLLTYYQTRSG